MTEVLEASGGAEALSVLESRTDVSILLTDCDMPVVSGPHLARQVLVRWPHIKVIAMSGQPRSSEMPAAVSILAKPFRAATLIAMIRPPDRGLVEAGAATQAPFAAMELIKKGKGHDPLSH